ncbi:MAG: choice-of-anchor J domain-containing protein [Bacteroidetes bacterium]|nr:choice-of-anchor J domain-containing protein [Bacteroidota bacterium]
MATHKLFNLATGLLIFIAFLSIPFTLKGQQNPGCPADESHRKLLEDPKMRQRFMQDMQKIKEHKLLQQPSATRTDSVRIVPVVVHVLHDNGKGAISKAQIENGLINANKNLRRLNADTTATRAIFKPYAADLKFEFRLANIDPDGNCTDGIVYINTPLTYYASDTCKSVSWWPTDKYFNFWTVNSIDPSPWNLGGTIGGYEQFPWTYGINQTYGAVVRHDLWGKIGTASSSSTDRTVTHEIGHCFGLWHMWQDQSLGGAGDGCTFIVGNDCTDNNDMICDTPPMLAPAYGCTYSLNSCGNDTVGPSPFTNDMPDQIENYMSYHSCQNMFTKGQKDFIDAVFATYPELQNLISPGNLIATGTNDGYTPPLCPPLADFDSNKKMDCKGVSISFSDFSKAGVADSWQWYFPGGNPSSSTAKNPVILYNNTGSFDVTLIAKNAAGTDTSFKKNYINISENTAQFSNSEYLEGFENLSDFNNNWMVVPSNGTGKWERKEGVSYSGNACIMVNNYTGLWYNETVEIISPSYDLSAIESPELTFKVAYAKYDDKTSETLKIYVSLDCGATWTMRYSKPQNLLSSVPDQTTPFIPNSINQWKQERLTPSPTQAASKNVRFKIELAAGKGNNLYIDDLNIVSKFVGIKEAGILNGTVKIHPNPAKQEANLSFATTQVVSDVNIAMYDLYGRRTSEILNGVDLLAGEHHYKIMLPVNIPGVYFVRMSSGTLNWTKKLVVY